MPNPKYGRLFTEDDLEMLLGIARSMESEGRRALAADVLAEVKPDGLTFPPDEPLFLLRGQDVAAPAAIATGNGTFEDTGRRMVDYVQSCLFASAPRPHVGAAWRAAAEMREWQAANPDRVKVPDA